MTYPLANLTSAGLATDLASPLAARAELLAAVQRLNDLIAQRGVAGGLAELDGSGKLPTARLPAVAAVPTPTVLTGTGTYTVPAGVTALLAELSGAGGGGGWYHVVSADPYDELAGWAGGAGAVTVVRMAVTPGQVISYACGVGGAAASEAPQAGVAGGATTFGGASAEGGGGGGNGSAPSGGAGGAGSGGSVHYPGGPGGRAWAGGGNRNAPTGAGAGSDGFGGGGAGHIGFGGAAPTRGAHGGIVVWA